MNSAPPLQRVRLEASWKARLGAEFDAPYMVALRQFLLEQKQQGKEIYPPGSEWFNSFELTPFDATRVVILGQDPYPGPGQAHGLCFSVRPGVEIPPSLHNIYQELASDLGIEPASHGCLESWARQGVLLLNSVLTVERGRPGAHQGRGWERFTDRVIELLNGHPRRLVFLLWGSQAQKKGEIIDPRRHCLLKAPHPSPLSAYRGFFGCRHFSKANDFLIGQGESAIDWRLPPVG
ncbi:MAG TPA: uracil-DNA glycosylase [Pseudomonadales bacterium]|nr:uracil-DNA glycosylase [Pseudomonadales bacterium]HMW16094.1 uracil-DNA glycosylase [Pseudomonadales bacterium]HMW84272.1 uracil-DNA glycosylase [Pseudomonadales bacterium]HMY97668.1 uracil-DNA glycosylase [Pseudomonadales bacterium]HMZ71690.1 uracil-DNA glycosylase [Pseudomonadales bacterium]